MNVRHPMGVLHSFAIKNVFFMIKWTKLRLFLFSCDNIYIHTYTQLLCKCTYNTLIHI